MRKEHFKSQYVFTLYIIFIIVGLTGCKKAVEVNAPVTSITTANVYTSDATAAAVLTGIYGNMSKGVFATGGFTSVSLLSGLSADELTIYNGVNNSQYNSFYRNALNSNSAGFEFWINFYQTIFAANSAISGLNASAGLTPSVKQQLLGEAKFVRAFCYFYLINLYGDVPLVTTTDYHINRSLSRTPKEQVWQQIIVDLQDAQTILNDNYLKGDAFSSYNNGYEERIRPNKWAAIALLARVYLYTENWVKAEEQSTLLINNSNKFSLVTNLNNVFLKNSQEAIWQLQPIYAGQNTQDARLFILPTTGPHLIDYPVYLSDHIINRFEVGDQRKMNWVNSVTVGATNYYYASKYKISTLNAPVNEFLMVLRLSEQYLIRAEARAQQNNIIGSQNDLNIIRNRAGLGITPANTQTTLRDAILHERQVELFTEWGHRWLDLKRSNTANAVMSVATPQKGGTWDANWLWYPIPLYDLKTNPNLIQNSGY